MSASPDNDAPSAEDIDAMERANGHRDYVVPLTAWCRALMAQRDALCALALDAVKRCDGCKAPATRRYHHVFGFIAFACDNAECLTLRSMVCAACERAMADDYMGALCPTCGAEGRRVDVYVHDHAHDLPHAATIRALKVPT